MIGLTCAFGSVLVFVSSNISLNSWTHLNCTLIFLSRSDSYTNSYPLQLSECFPSIPCNTNCNQAVSIVYDYTGALWSSLQWKFEEIAIFIHQPPLHCHPYGEVN
jgi:hypothetical protein